MSVNAQATDLSKTTLPVNAVEFTPLSTTTTLASAWIDISGLKSSTVFVKGLETGGTVKVEVAHGAAAPAAGAILATLAPDANNCAQQSVGPFHWLRLTKTQGGTPTASVCSVYGLFQ
jgi:poly(3-hydroxybutyrate) depolymerase